MPAPRLCFPLASGFVLNLSYAATARRVAPEFLKSRADSLSELHILCQCSLARAPPLCGFTFCHIDFLQSHSRFIGPLPHPPKRILQGLRSAFKFFIICFFLEIESIQVLLFGCHCLSLLRSQILRDFHEKNHDTAPQCNSRSSFSATPGVVLRTQRIEKVKLPEFQNTTP